MLAVKMIGLGVDYSKFVRFSSITPHVGGPNSEGVYVVSQPVEELGYSREEIEFCMDFCGRKRYTSSRNEIICVRFGTTPC